MRATHAKDEPLARLKPLYDFEAGGVGSSRCCRSTHHGCERTGRLAVVWVDEPADLLEWFRCQPAGRTLFPTAAPTLFRIVQRRVRAAIRQGRMRRKLGLLMPNATRSNRLDASWRRVLAL